MSRSIDQRIVEMRFDNAQFERGAKDTMSLLDRLKEALKFGSAKSGLQDIQSAANGFSLDGMAAGVDNISSKFSALGAIGFSVLQDLTKRAIDFGGQLIRNTLDPLIGGGRTRAMNMEQANFQFEGLGMDVEATMENALAAVQGTAYGLDEAAVLAANFGATGMEAGQDMEDALRGVSGVAAMAGASYSDIGQIFGTVAGQGRLMGNDLNRLAARGVNAAATMAKQMGITEAEFREMVSSGEITFDMFAQGMNEAFGEHATRANETYTGSLSNMRAALARVGAEFFTPHLTRQRDLFNALTPLIDRTNEALGPLMSRLNDFLGLRYERFIGFLEMLDQDHTGGRILESVMRAIGQAADTLMSFLSPIAGAFADIFGGASIDGVVGFTDALTAFLASIELSSAGGENLRRTFAGIFAIFDIGFYVLGQVVAMFGRLIGVAFEGTDGFLGFTAGIGDWLVAVRDAIKEGDLLSTVIGWIETAFRNVISFVQGAGGMIADFFSGFSLGGLPDFSDAFTSRLTPLATFGAVVSSIWNGVLDLLKQVGTLFAPLGSAIADWASDIGTRIADALANTDWNFVLDVINTALLGGLVWILRNFFGDIGDAVGGGFGLMDKIDDIFGGLTDTLTTMQNNLKADTLMKIAGAIALLAASVLVLSFIDPGSMTTALTGLTVMLGQLMGAMAIFSSIATTPAALKLPLIAAGLTLLAAALLIFSIPVLLLSRLSWDDLVKGLVGLAGTIGLMAASAHLLSGASGSFIRLGLSMIPFATGVFILGEAVRRMGNLEWDEIARGLVGVAGSITAIALGMQIMPANILVRSVAITVLAGALLILGEAVRSMGSMSWDEIGRGLVTLGGALAIMAVGLSLMNGTVAGSMALIIAAGAMTVLAGPLKEFGQMGWEEIGKGLTMLAGALLVLAGGLYLMSGTLLGSASLIVAAGALMVLAGPLKEMGAMGWDEIGRGLTVLAGALLALAGGLFLMSGTLLGSAALVVAAVGLGMLMPVLITMSQLSWTEILTGLAGLAVTLGAIALAGALLTPVLPSLLLLGVALGLMGVGMMAAGAGMAFFAVGFATVVGAIAGSGSVIIDFIIELIELLPRIAIALAQAIVDFVVELGNGATRIAQAIGELIMAIIDEARTLIPEFISLVGDVIMAMLEEIERLSPQFKDTFVTVLLDMLGAFEEVSPRAIEVMMGFIQDLLDELERNIPNFMESGANILNAVVDGILTNVFKVDPTAILIVTTFISGIASNLGSIFSTGINMVSSLLSGITTENARTPAMAFLLVTTFISGVASTGPRLIASGIALVANIMTGVRDGIQRSAALALREAVRIGSAIIDGIRNGIIRGAASLARSASTVVGGVVGSIRGMLGINSPSRVFMEIGGFIDEGLALGIENNAGQVLEASTKVAQSTIDAINEALEGVADEVGGELDMDPVVRPVIDLSDAEKSSKILKDLLSTEDAYRGYSVAEDIAATPFRTVGSEAPTQISKSYKFEQNNHSPKSLSTPEIYRNTKNLISRSKEAIDAN